MAELKNRNQLEKLTMRYHVRLFMYLSDEAHFTVRLEKEITLPFIPSVTISLGLEDYSTFHNDETIIKEVMWIIPLDEFHVAIEDVRLSGSYAKEYCEIFIKEGWKTCLGVNFSEANDALQCANDYEDSKAVCVDGKFFVLSDHEQYSLQKDGRDFAIISDEDQCGRTKEPKPS